MGDLRLLDRVVSARARAAEAALEADRALLEVLGAGVSPAQVARAFGVSRQAVNDRAARARRRLEGLKAGEAGADDDGGRARRKGSR